MRMHPAQHSNPVPEKPYHSAMTIFVNGRPHETAPGTTVDQLLVDLGLASGPCAVEIDRILLPRAQHAAHTLTEGAHVEIVTLVGGG